MFRNRVEAGRKLAEAMQDRSYKDGVVLAIPRGGVVVGAQVARSLKTPLDLVIPRKIGAPHNPEAAVGAVAQDGTTIFNHQVLSILGIGKEDLQGVVEEQVEEIHRRMKMYRGREDYPSYDNKQVILVDDGIATGYTVLAALRSVKNMFKLKELILAIPVAPPDTLNMLRTEVDRVVCLLTPPDFYAVGQFYVDFPQTTDEEVISLLRESDGIHHPEA
ncbi:MAG TPA: phosphoribosyltransferase [Desulfotomaculum sp.]|nr:phosphoribosyltransferase [Desulfotomaculum sp.]